jgi:hypothetical protein
MAVSGPSQVSAQAARLGLRAANCSGAEAGSRVTAGWDSAFAGKAGVSSNVELGERTRYSGNMMRIQKEQGANLVLRMPLD